MQNPALRAMPNQQGAPRGMLAASHGPPEGAALRIPGNHMLEYSIVEPGGILRVAPSGALTVEDFAGLARFADAYLNTHGTLGGLLIEAQAFPGWDSFAALSAHLRFLRDHQRRIERIALVTDSPIAHVAGIACRTVRGRGYPPVSVWPTRRGIALAADLTGGRRCGYWWY